MSIVTTWTSYIHNRGLHCPCITADSDNMGSGISNATNTCVGLRSGRDSRCCSQNMSRSCIQVLRRIRIQLEGARPYYSRWGWVRGAGYVPYWEWFWRQSNTSLRVNRYAAIMIGSMYQSIVQASYSYPFLHDYSTDRVWKFIRVR